MKDYILNDKIISTTENRYEKEFKDQGYVPYNDTKILFNNEKNLEKSNKKLEEVEKFKQDKNKKISTDETE